MADASPGLRTASPKIAAAPQVAERAPTSADGFIEIKVLADSKPREGAEVRLLRQGSLDPNTGKLVWSAAGSAVTGPDGTARIAARAGVYLAVAQDSGVAKAMLRVRHPLGELLTRIQLELQRGSSLEGRTIVRGSKEPAALAQLVCTPYLDEISGSLGGFADAPAEVVVRAASDVRGDFFIPHLTPGYWQVEASAPGAGRALARGIRVPRQGPLILELIAPSYIEGHVLLADNSPAAGAEVFARGNGPAEFATTSDSGAFSIEVAPGGWMISARRGIEAGAEPHSIAVAEGETHRGVEIRLGIGAAIFGDVVHRGDGAPLDGARILISPHNKDGDIARTVSDAAGKFAVEGLVAGVYDAIVERDGSASGGRRGVALASGQRYELRVELSGSGSVEGTVRDPQSRPIEGALVGTQESMFSSGKVQARSGADGSYRLLEVASGRASLVATRSGSKMGALQAVNVREGETVHADFVLKATGRITGRVTRATGALPDDARVTAMRDQPAINLPDIARVPISADGSYELELPAGTYRLAANASDQSSQRSIVGVEPDSTQNIDLVLPDADETGLTVRVLEPGGAPSPMAEMTASAPQTGAGRGWFAGGGVADMNGIYKLQRPRADLPDTILVTATNGARSGKVTVPPGQTQAVVQLQAAASLHGRLIDGAPIASFNLQITSTDQPPNLVGFDTVLAFSGDRFDLDDQAAGTFKLHATTSDGRNGDATVTIEPGGNSSVEIPLTAATAITGRAVDENGAPVANANVWCDRDNPSESDANGAFQIAGIAPGAHHLSGYAQPGLNASRDIKIAQGQQLDLGDLIFQARKAAPGTIGISLRGDSSGVAVSSVISGSPADLAGLLYGDKIVAIDGVPPTGITDASARIRGAPGTPVSLTLNRGGRVMVLQIVRAS